VPHRACRIGGGQIADVSVEFASCDDAADVAA
jgi:hypothetical protein